MKKIQAAACWVVLAAVGCSGTANSGGSEVMGGGGSAGSGVGGTGFVPIGSNGGGGMAGSGGAAGSAALAGSAGLGGSGITTGGSSGTTTGGASGAVGSAGAGSLGTPGYPSGAVILCFGAGCPMGECDNDQFFADQTCSSVYPSDIGPNSTYCKPAETDSYCLETGPSFGPDYAVSCANGTATVLKCSRGCGSGGDGTSVYRCTSF